MKRVLVLCLLFAQPVFAIPAPPLWWQAPPEVLTAVREKMFALLNPIHRPGYPYRQQFQFRDKSGLLWLTVRRVGDDVQEFNRNGRLISHAWRQGRQIRVVWMDEQGRWHQR